MARGGGHFGGGFHGGGFHGGGFGRGYGGYHRRGYYGTYFSTGPTFTRGHYMDGRAFQFSHASTYREMERKLNKTALMIVLVIFCLAFSGIIGRYVKNEFRKTFFGGTKISGTVLTSYVYDGLGTLNGEVVEAGAAYFYDKTGIQPVVYTTAMTDYQIGQSGINLMESLYDELFNDEGHILLVLSGYELGNTMNYQLSYFYGGEVDKIMGEGDFNYFYSWVKSGCDGDVSISSSLKTAFMKTADRVDPEGKSLVRKVIWCCGIGGVIMFILGGIYIIKRRLDEEEIIKNARPEVEQAEIPGLEEFKNLPAKTEEPEVEPYKDPFYSPENDDIVYSNDGPTISWKDFKEDMEEMAREQEDGIEDKETEKISDNSSEDDNT
ncbi:MAG: hypothetical protein K6F92_03925 [Lachnospiraceae bacterium]|nr:hypothetical protein [Lachnospiraceae bacterium]